MMRQDALRRVQWKDLRDLTLKEMLIENTLTVPWLISSWFFAYHEYFWLALPCSAFFFLTALRQSHNGFHNSLGTNKTLTWLCLYLNSILMVASVHAIKFNHLRHHRYCLQEEDQEGKAAHMTWYGAILYGPIHVFKVHQLTWQLGDNSYQRNMAFELVSISLFVFLVIYFNVHWLIYHVVIMAFGECLMAFFAVWMVHHDTHDNPKLARTQRSYWKNKMTFSMFYHLEHHLFPAVPTIKLPTLAQRIDEAIPEIEKKQTF